MQLLHKNDMSIIFDLNMRYLDLVSLSRGHKLCLFIVKNILNNLMMAEKGEGTPSVRQKNEFLPRSRNPTVPVYFCRTERVEKKPKQVLF